MNGAIDTACTKPGTNGDATPIPWVSGMCGTVWMLKHHGASEFSDVAAYPPSGSNAGYDISNQGAWTKALGYLQMGISLCGSDGGDPVGDRGCRLAAMASAYLWDHALPDSLNSWGRPSANDSYNKSRVAQGYLEYVIELTNSVVGFPSLASPLNDDLGLEWLYEEIPYMPGWGVHYGQAVGYGNNISGQGNGTHTIPITMYGSASSAPAVWYWLNNTNFGPVGYSNPFWQEINLGSGGSRRSYTPLWYVWVDPNTPQTNKNTLPLQRFFGPRSSSLCSSLNLNCSIYKTPTHEIFSKTGWGTSDTLLYIDAHGDTEDGHGGYHGNYYCPGCIGLYRNQALLRGNDQAPAGSLTPTGSQDDNLIEIGGTADNYPGGRNCTLAMSIPFVSRWAGTNPTGDSSGRYAYAMVDLTNTYCSPAGITHAWKHVIHFKKSTNQDYVVAYFDGAASSPIQFREFIHYRLHQDEADTVYSPGISISRSAKTVSLGDTTTSAQLNSKFLNVAGSSTIYVDTQNSADTDCSYSGGLTSPPSCRIEIGSSTNGTSLGSVSTAEWAYVHQPSTSTSTTMPTITQPTCSGTGGTCSCVQIADSSSPKVACFARQGATLTGMTVTTTHSGTAQYVLSGLQAGTISSVTMNGSAISGAPTSIAANDNSAYFESTAGALSVGAGAAPTVSTVAITPSSATISYTGTQTYTCLATWSDSSTDACPGATWASDNTAAATVSAGTASGVAAGTAHISATYQSVGSNSATLNVTGPVTTRTVINGKNPFQGGYVVY
jgi:hypothetical protein